MKKNNEKLRLKRLAKKIKRAKILAFRLREHGSNSAPEIKAMTKKKPKLKKEIKPRKKTGRLGPFTLEVRGLPEMPKEKIGFFRRIANYFN